MGQNVPYALLTDKPNAQTLGQGIVEGLVPRSNMRFASRSERGATITSPAAGMVTWINDLGVLEAFDGAVWTTVAAGQSTWTTVPLASDWQSPTIGDVNNNQGRFQYRIVNLFGELSIMFRGGIGRTTYPSSLPTYFLLNTSPLPPEHRPASLRTIVVPCSDVGSERITLKLDIRADNGEIRLYGIQPKSKPIWVGFNGCFVSL
ncbi:hypothetical protein [Streptomyces sp. 6N106]|uniref:hypothetical protein n=1 Tax=Streptomyces sp. 6N106 TaxID=3457418 RepID=UPI003FD17938